jgi:hypothetical protein
VDCQWPIGLASGLAAVKRETRTRRTSPEHRKPVVPGRAGTGGLGGGGVLVASRQLQSTNPKAQGPSAPPPVLQLPLLVIGRWQVAGGRWQASGGWHSVAGARRGGPGASDSERRGFR